MIIILAFAAWSLLLAVVGIVTGVAALTTAAAGIGALAVGCAVVVLVAAMRTPDPRTLVRRSRAMATA